MNLDSSPEVASTNPVSVQKRVHVQDTMASVLQPSNHGDIKIGDMLAIFAHEVKTPLHSINLMIELLKEEINQNDDQTEYLSIICNCIEQLNETVDIFFNYTRLQKGMINRVEKEFDLSETLDESISMLSHESHKKKIDLTYEYSYDIPTEFIGDKKNIKQIILNLISNAIKFTNQNGNISVSVCRGHLQGQDVSNLSPLIHNIEVSVKDTGIGIPEVEIGKIFDPFFQVDRSLSRTNTGLGLGLSVIQKIVHLLNGTIRVTSVENEGSNFIVTLPLKKVEHHDSSISINNNSISINNSSTSTNNKKSAKDEIEENESEELKMTDFSNKLKYSDIYALIVDDNESNRIGLSSILLSIGIKSVSVSSGKETLMYLQNGHRFDIAFLDIKMPEMDGIELARRIHAIDKKTIIIALSSVSKSVDIDIRTIFRYWIMKPIQKKNIIKLIYRSLDNHCVKKESSSSPSLLSSSSYNTMTPILVPPKNKKRIIKNISSASILHKQLSTSNSLNNTMKSIIQVNNKKRGPIVIAKSPRRNVFFINIREKEKRCVQSVLLKLKDPTLIQGTYFECNKTVDGYDNVEQLTSRCLKMKTKGYTFDIIMINVIGIGSMEDLMDIISTLRNLSPLCHIICVIKKKHKTKYMSMISPHTGISSFLCTPLNKLKVHATFVYYMKKK